MATEPAQSLVDRVWQELDHEPSTRTVRMFGGLSFMVHDKMVVAAREGDALLVRVDADRSDELTARPGAAIAEMGTGRSMGRGWIEVEPDALDDDGLSFWIAEAMAFNAKAKRSK